METNIDQHSFTDRILAIADEAKAYIEAQFREPSMRTFWDKFDENEEDDPNDIDISDTPTHRLIYGTDENTNIISICRSKHDDQTLWVTCIGKNYGEEFEVSLDNLNYEELAYLADYIKRETEK